MPFIQNISLANIKNGHHMLPGENAILIQIVDPDTDFPVPKYAFKETHRFKFLDLEEPGLTNNGDGILVDESCHAITQKDADTLVGLLARALENRMNVLIHCHAGICRSGAVAEIGVMMGFQDTEVYRQPNLLVKYRMMKALGWTYEN